MELFPIPRFLATGSNQRLIDNFVDSVVNTFNGHNDRTFTRVYRIELGNRVCYIQNNWEDLQHIPSMLIHISSDGSYEKNDRKIPQIVVQINEKEVPEQVVGDIHFISITDTNEMSTLSVMSYVLTFHDCFPLGLHRRTQISHNVVLLLKRVFRSLDTKFTGKMQMSEFSKFHAKYLGAELSPSDMLLIFEAIHDGSEPASISQFMQSSLDFESFLKLMQYYVTLGYGSVILQIIRGGDYYYFFRKDVEIAESIFGGMKPQGLQEPAITFLHNVYADFGIDNVLEHVEDEFRFSGGAPERFRNVREMGEETWITKWKEWSALDPSETARALLTLGFPRDFILKAFGIKKPEQSKSVGLVAGIAATALSVGGAWFFLQRRK